MKKRDLLALGMLVLCAGLTMGACQGGAPNSYQRAPGNGNYANGDFDQNFYNSLSPENQRRFDQLDSRARANVMQYFRDNGSRDANKALDHQMRNGRRTSQVETKEKAEVAATTAPVETKAAAPAPVEAEKAESKVSSATSTATTTVQ